MQTKKSPAQGQNNYPGWEAIEGKPSTSQRKRGGEMVRKLSAEQPKKPDGTQRNTEGLKAKYPLQTSRPGERRI